MNLYCGRWDAPTLTHRGRHDRQDDDSLIASADRSLCLLCGATGT
jgi:hypothetical protein